MKRPPLVSVIMGIYNRRVFLREAIESVLSQSDPNFELILVDDGSRAEMGDFLDTFNDPRLVKIHLPSHAGIPAARNEGLRKAQGEWITFLDSDDLMPRDSLKLRLSTLRKNSCYRVVFGKTAFILQKRSSTRLLFPRAHSWMEACYQYARRLGEVPKGVARWTNCIPWPLTSQLFHRLIFHNVGLLDQSFVLSDDTEFGYRVNDLVPSRFVDETVLFHRRHQTNFSFTVPPHLVAAELQSLHPRSQRA